MPENRAGKGLGFAREDFSALRSVSQPDFRVDMDDCLPFAVWPYKDLRNLMPAHSSVNRTKGQRPPSAERLETTTSGAQMRSWPGGRAQGAP